MSISPVRRANWCRRGSISGSRPTSRSSWRRCSRSPPPRTSPAWRAASPSNSSKRSACWSARRCPTRSRASTSRRAPRLRKYGVRFGAYHIYLPALLKPAPRALATQLWALKNEAPDAKGVADLLHLAASGRTSIPVDKETPKPLYRTAGYRVCGDRAVRVDILERLADLIRPALSWREHAAGPKPDGAVDGRSFTVTGAMTSLTGASGEDFASILRALGYRMERRPKPPEAEKPAAAEPRRRAKRPPKQRAEARVKRRLKRLLPSRQRRLPRHRDKRAGCRFRNHAGGGRDRARSAGRGRAGCLRLRREARRRRAPTRSKQRPKGSCATCERRRAERPKPAEAPAEASSRRRGRQRAGDDRGLAVRAGARSAGRTGRAGRIVVGNRPRHPPKAVKPPPPTPRRRGHGCARRRRRARARSAAIAVLTAPTVRRGRIATTASSARIATPAVASARGEETRRPSAAAAP